MKKQFFLAIAISASIISLGAFAAGESGDQPSSTEATTSNGSADSGSVGTAQVGGMSFEDLDRNQDDKISWGEANMDPTVTEQFSQYDRDNDGSISSSEFGAVGAGPGGGAGESQTPNGSASGTEGGATR